MTHSLEFTDTDPCAMEAWLDLLRQKTPGERLLTALGLTDLALKMTETGGRALYPNASDRDVFLRVAARHLPREFMLRAYARDPESDSGAR